MVYFLRVLFLLLSFLLVTSCVYEVSCYSFKPLGGVVQEQLFLKILERENIAVHLMDDGTMDVADHSDCPRFRSAWSETKQRTQRVVRIETRNECVLENFGQWLRDNGIFYVVDEFYDGVESFGVLDEERNRNIEMVEAYASVLRDCGVTGKPDGNLDTLKTRGVKNPRGLPSEL